ncbi:uncharacterized protein At2g39920 isoform X1 [Rosa rugosa]|uniref:uncharacterized protein At2g39920 isoform X1 n=1 Tax=Rosa rugosa TaxID=74645 RepID=UPI002B41680B|nr:uncharacterized protein At2g39920 isoform X1 [Rosa rugosa]XP_061998216.1 uncharacterized protein At2g39920 isoform X1 [Rosa rugosa]XP_061998217.1 uncharacterized protein At2g39920 isoform X1 [Rosa rugosa]XP_061998218.1 uncharacterized protein At2g39920 isoform X1 [Rosa rugosa]XP_061998219.1 uncharacterized protein At2g39920 isoform X1 [Rosa rugosa]XP_061998220.1 uncharacterized protein At2g39920 isoform X1 [Rosa rugosa]XP_061998221.1 uncharacterized protein At2g39920 isoform X1 [Rosa rugos
MSAYGHHMEREYSAQSLSSREVSERTSSYAMESGFYMSSFATTIFIASLVTVGLLFITLLIALTVMLQSCESKSRGIVEVQKPSYDSNYCHIFSLHMELNNFEADQFPSVCRVVASQYIKQGQYATDLNSTMGIVEDYFGSITPQHDGLDVVLMDVDDILSLNPQYSNFSVHRYDHYGCSDCMEEAKHLKHMLILRLYMKLHSSGWPLILLSRKPETHRNTSVEYLVSAGYTAWSSLIMSRSEAELHMDSSDYFSKRRAAMQREGFRIIGIISSHMDALRGPFLGRRIFKLPNPIYNNFEYQIEDIHTPK